MSHVFLKRLNIAPEDASVEEIEAELMKKIPKRDWIISHHRMIFFGRYHCLAKNPKCQTCPLQSYCKYYKETTKNKLENVIFFGFLQL